MSFDLVARLKLQDDFSSKMRQATNQMQLGQKASTGLTSGVKSFGKTVMGISSAIGLTAAVAGGFRMIRDSVGSAFSRIDTMEQFDRTMTVLTGSSEKTAAALEATREAVTGTAYGLDVAAKGVQDFVTRGMDIEKATSTMAAWGDAVAFYGDGSNEQLASVSEALAKMTSSGKVSMQYMDALYNAGIDGVGMYAQAVGRDVESVQKDLSSGAITAEEFIDTVSTAMMEGTNGVVKVAGAAKEAGATWGATFDNMRAAVTRGVVNIVTKIDEMLETNGLPDMRQMVADFGVKFEEVLNKIAEAIPVIVAKIKSIYDTVAPYFPLIKELVIGAGIAFLTFKGIAMGLSVISTVTTVFSALRGLLIGTTAAQWGLNAAMLANPVTWIVVGIAALIAIGVLLWRNWDTIKEKAGELWSKISEVFGNIKDWIVEKLGAAKDFVVSIFTKMPGIVAEKLGYMLGVAVTWLSKLPGKFKEWFTRARDNAVSIVKELPGKIAGFIKQIPSRISGVIGTIWSKFKEVGAAIPKAIAEGFKSALAGLGKAAKWAIDKVIGGLDGLKSLGSSVVSRFSSGYNEGRGSSHYHGLDYVPRDGYQATLHRGERVLTAEENKTYNKGGNVSVSINGVTVREEADIERITDALVRKIMQAQEAGA